MTSGSHCATKADHEFEPESRSWRPRTLPVRTQDVCQAEGNTNSSVNITSRRTPRSRSRVGLHVRPDRDQRRQAAARPHRGARAPRTSSPRRWSPRCSARTPSVLRDVPEISDVARRARAARAARRAASTDGADEGELLLDPTQRRAGARRRHRRARRLQPHPDPVLRAAAAPARRGVHPRPRRLPHRRPPDRLPPRRAAPVRRRRREAAERHPAHRPERPARRQASSCPTRASARPSRCCSRPCAPRASPSCATRPSSPRSWISSPSCRRWARSSSVEHRPRHPHRGRRDARAATTTAPSSTATRPRAGPAAALATDGDIFVGGARQQEMMTFLNVFRKVGGAFDIHDDGIRFFHPRRRRSSPSSSRPTCTPAS